LFGAISTISAEVVKGTVIDDTGEPVIGASVVAKGTQVGTTTNLDGEFTLDVPSGAKTLVITYLGYTAKEVAVTPVVKVTLQTSDQILDEVLVTVAYGQVKKRALTGAVSSVEAAKIEQRPVSSVSNVLEGIQGIQVSNVYGQPGSEPDIRIRGFTTINGSNSPLWVIDGVPFGGNISDLNPQDIATITVLKDAASAALYGNRAANGVILVTTKVGSSEKSTINVTMNQGFFERGIPEYERMGANDYMETMWLGYRNQLLLSAATNTPEKAGAAASSGLIESILGYNIYNQQGTQLFDANGKLVAGAAILDGYKDDLNWFKPVVRNGHRQEYSVAMNGKTAKTASYLSVGYLDEKGYIVNSGFNRYTAMGKMNVTPNKWFETGASLRGSYQNTDNTNGKSDASYTNAFMYARNIAPIYPIHLHDQAGAYVLDATGNKIFDNGAANEYTTNVRKQYADRHLVQEIGLNKNTSIRETLELNTFGQVKFLNNFKFRVSGNLNVRVDENEVYDNAIIGDGKGNNGRAGFEDYRYKDYTFQQQLYYDKLFNEKHSVNLFVGHENTANSYWYSYGRKATETFAGLSELVNFSDITSLTGYRMDVRYESYLGSAKYNYNTRYYIDGSFRRDGSSRFDKPKRWGNFYSVSGSWIVTEEEFMQGLKDQINFLKFRTGYGEVGNDQSVGRYASMALYAMTTNAGQSALYKSQLEALDIQWEAATSFGIALEGRLFNRVDFNVEYFDKRSRDLLFDVYLPLSTGSTTSSAAESTITKNLGSIANKGVEFGVTVEVIKNRDFQWNLGLDATVYKNKILSLPEQNRKNGIIDGTKKYMEGTGMYDFWTYQFAGVDQMSGRSLYQFDNTKYTLETPTDAEKADGKIILPAEAERVTINGNTYVYKTTYALRDFSGSVIPDIAGAFNTSVRYKDFTLNAQATYSLGNQIMDYTYQSYMSATASPSSLHKDLLKSWNGVPEGMTETSPNRIDPNGIPEVNFSRSADNNATSTRFLKNGSYLTLKVVNLSYNVPKNIVNKLDITSARISLTAENLFILTAYKGVNPQQSFNGLQYNYLTTPRILSLGLNVQF
jgi:TonB-linked SusC/RagA family outer membrane protein